MSHSQFHCTGRAYLDMHGLIFETSICYWQDQPGRGKREHTEPGVAGARGAGRGRRGGGRPPQRGREGRRTPGPDRQPTLGTTRGRGAPPRRRSVEGRGWGGFPFPAPLPPTHTTSAAHNLGAARERGRGPREVARRPGRHVPARSRSLARADGGGGARAEARTPPFPARPPGAGRGGHGGRSTTAGREPDDPRSGERARAGRSTAGGQTAVPPRPTHNDVARRAAVAADHGAEPRQARGATHTGTRPGDRQTRRTRRVDGRERGPTGRGWLGRHRADAATTSQKPWREGAAARHREGARGAGPKGPGASRPPGHDTGSHRQRPPAQGRSRSTQDADWPPQPPQGRAPLAGLATTTAKHPRAAAGPQEHSPARTPAAPRTPPHTHLRRARLPRLRNREHSTRGRRRPRRPVGRHPHEGEAGSAPDGEGDVGGGSWGGGGGGPAATGRGRHAHPARATGQRRGALPRERKGRDTTGPPGKQARGPTATHTRAVPRRLRRRPAPATLGPPRDPAPPPGPACVSLPPRATEGPVHPNSTSPSSPDPPSSKSDRRGSRPRETLPSEATRTAPTHRRRLRLAVRAGATRSSWLRDWGVGTSGRPRPLELTTGVTARARTHTRTHARPRAGRRPGGTLPRLRGGEARAAVGKERRTAPPRGRRKPSREGEGLCPRALAVATVATARLGGAAAGGSGTPRLPLGSLEKAFSPRVHHPPPIVSPLGPRRRSTNRPVHEWAGWWGGSAVRVSTRPTGALAATAGGTTSAAPRPNTIPPTAQPWEDDRDEAAPGPPPRGGKQRHASLTVSTPLKRATQGTHHRGGDPRSTLGKGNDTTARPQAPEGQPGALQGHHRRPSKARSRASRGAQRSGGTAPPTDAGRTAREAHAKEAKRECLLCPRTTDPPAP